MPAYKDEKQNTWYCQFYYEDCRATRRKSRREDLRQRKKLWNGREITNCLPMQIWI